jgi:hypothetical protein
MAAGIRNAVVANAGRRESINRQAVDRVEKRFTKS